MVATYRCTLKCKLCAAYAPYYKNPDHYEYGFLAKQIDSFFDIVDTVRDFSLSGGEPLLHKDIARLLLKLLEYKERIKRILILTNGTLLMREELLDVLEENR